MHTYDSQSKMPDQWMIISRKRENSVLVQSLGGVSSVSKIDHECREHLQLSLWWCFAGTQRYYYSSLIVLVTCCVIDLFSCIDEDWTMVINTLDISNMSVMVEATVSWSENISTDNPEKKLTIWIRTKLQSSLRISLSGPHQQQQFYSFAAANLSIFPPPPSAYTPPHVN